MSVLPLLSCIPTFHDCLSSLIRQLEVEFKCNQYLFDQRGVSMTIERDLEAGCSLVPTVLDILDSRSRSAWKDLFVE